ncbi:hypothetical protein MKX03_022670 [Papaver bracteatum]|nr:hypothetical protein MKX03_022670 [Papaver bracteatum]
MEPENDIGRFTTPIISSVNIYLIIFVIQSTHNMLSKNMCEFMFAKSVYGFLHHKGIFKLPSLLKVSMEVSKVMNYLCHNNVIQCD